MPSRCRGWSRGPSRTTPQQALRSWPGAGRSAPKDRGWLGGLQRRIPFDLRGDRDGLPRLGWRGRGLGRPQGPAGALHRAGGEHGVVEERRLAYVAATRARHALLLTASVWAAPSSPRVTSGSSPRSATPGAPVAHGPWGALPAGQARSPRAPAPRVPGDPWPGDPGRGGGGAAGGRAAAPPGRAGARRRAARALAGARRSTSCSPSGRSGAGRDAAVELAPHLSTSALVALARDPATFASTCAARCRRPGRRRPAGDRVPRLGRGALLPGRDGRRPRPAGQRRRGPRRGGAAGMKARFLAASGPAQARRGRDGLETVVDGIAVRGRVDAVFARPGGARFTVVDWKTGPRPAGTRRGPGPCSWRHTGSASPGCAGSPGGPRGVLLRRDRRDGVAGPPGPEELSRVLAWSR